MEDQGIEPPERDAPAKEERAEFEIIFENKREEPVKVFHDNGAPFFVVGKQSIILEAYDPRAMYSRYKEVTFKKNGEIGLEENRKWRNPYPLSVELVNLDGVPLEGLTLGGQNVIACKGISRFAEVRLDEDAVFYKSFTWKKIKVKKERDTLPGYFEEIEEVHLIKELRSEKEIKALRLQRAGIVDRKAELAKAKILEGK
jgi:hypothetical protein